MAKERYNPQVHHRRSIRLRAFDYATPTEYFITICTNERECFFGQIESGIITLSHIGRIANQCWVDIPNHFTNVELDEYEVMPNHVHGILRIKSRSRGVQLNAPTSNHSRLSPKKGTLSVVVRTYKGAVTTLCHEKGFAFFGWQRDFHDHIIRDQNNLRRIRKYIRDNVKNWETDEENLKVIAKGKKQKG